MKKNAFLKKIIGAASSALLLAVSMAPMAVSAATTSGYLDLNESVIIKGHAYVQTVGNYNILVDQQGYKYELNSTSVINTNGLYLYLENTAPAMADSIKSTGHLTVAAGIGDLIVQPSAAAAAIDVKTFKMLGLQSPASVTVNGTRNIGIRATGDIEINGISHLSVIGTQDGIVTGGSVWATNGSDISSTGTYGTGIRSNGSVKAYNNSIIYGEATSGTVGIQAGSFVKAYKNSTLNGVGLDKGIYTKNDVYSEYNSFVEGTGTSPSAQGVVAEGAAKVDYNSCLDGTGASYGILINKNIIGNQFSIITGTATFGVGIRANNKSGYNQFSNYTDITGVGGEYGFSSGKSTVFETGTTASFNATVNAGLRIDNGYLTVQSNSATVKAYGVMAGVDIDGKSSYAVIVKNAATLTAFATGKAASGATVDSIGILVRNKAGLYAGLGGIVNAQGQTGGISLYYGAVFSEAGIITARSGMSGLPIKADLIKKTKNGMVNEYRMLF